MARVRVISADVGPPSRPATTDDAYDEHNRPRLRRALICDALLRGDDRSARLASSSFARPPSSEEASTACDLVRLYGPVHDEGMVRFLVEAWSKWRAMRPWDKDNCLPGWNSGRPRDGNDGDGDVPPLVPCHSAFRRGGDDGVFERPSGNVMGAIGYYCTDSVTPVVGTLPKELREDAYVVCAAVDVAFLPGEVAAAYALTTHPGHHASRDCFGGYCYLNNAALCARLMQRRVETGRSIVRDDGAIDETYWDDDDGTTRGRSSAGKGPRAAILDVDYHCGNGTASIFYRDPTVLFVSIHCDPEVEYPWNTGYADETGVGEGEGATLHLPLEPGADWDRYKSALERAMAAIVAFDPAALVVSLGLDTHAGDSVAVNRGGFELSGDDYVEMGLCIGGHVAGRSIPCVFVQEGGYKMDVVGRAAADVLNGFADGASGGQ